MAVYSDYIELASQGYADVHELTNQVEAVLKASALDRGIVTVSVIGSTGAMTTCEYEPGLVRDLADLLDKLIPAGNYHHDERWGDGNGHAHLRSSLIGPSVTIPFINSDLVLGTWQQIIFIDFDNRPRQRKLMVQVMGE